jgi:hypothetical protein
VGERRERGVVGGDEACACSGVSRVVPVRALACPGTSGHVTLWRMPTSPVSLACTNMISEVRAIQ